MMVIGVLALQGGFSEHIQMLRGLGAAAREIRQPADWAAGGLDGLVIPGGESTVMGKLLVELELMEPIRAAIAAGLPVFGTCAGLILLARFLGLGAGVRRNAYGRQLGSFATEADFAGRGAIPMVFIRAPYIESTSQGVEVLSVVDGHIVAARQKNILATSFHPELTGSPVVHEYFLDMVAA
ncbi:MAG: pyridoxal 5'-phosphate synthase glutaminase subunit PdxT [Candidatus Adiutrix sp.]|nr:pyridoxal 5'-phosphate synthase glutaminase subunit PdxT [Candidatus Adiutrix sp.]